MSAWFMILLLLLDLGAAAAFANEGRWATAGVWLSYAMAQGFWTMLARGSA